jgi:hypothetical protein
LPKKITASGKKNLRIFFLRKNFTENNFPEKSSGKTFQKKLSRKKLSGKNFPEKTFRKKLSGKNFPGKTFRLNFLTHFL